MRNNVLLLPFLLATVSLVAGCSSIPMWQAADRAVEAPAIAPAAPEPRPSPVMEFVAAAVEGDRTKVADPFFGGEVVAEIEAEYLSASGRSCKRFSLRSGAGPAGQTFHACIVDGAWRIAGIY